MTKRIIQPNNYSCYACVAAMITGETLQNVVDFCGNDGSGDDPESPHPEKVAGFGDREIFRYLSDRGYHVGTWSHFPNYASLEDIDNIQIEIELSVCAAIVVVKSKRFPGCNHVLYWDSEKLFDPCPEGNENPSFSEYEVYSFMPVFRWED